jgi:ABC-type branched-subunit amino acid transport system substrate-binding protein
LLLGAPRFVADGVAALRHAGLGGLVYALSYAPAALIRQVAGSAARGVALAQVCPNPNGATMALQRAFQSAMKAAGASGPCNAFHFEGYITARVLAEGLRRAQEPTPAALVRSLRAMGEYDLGGYRVNFAKGNVGSSFVDIAIIDGSGQLVY